jgi:hypothetical protein
VAEKGISRNKLEEAIFFYDRMYEAYQSGQEECRYYMNAFLSSARSVTLFIQKQYSHTEGFIEWWEKNTVKSQPMFKKFNSLRTITIHRSSLKKTNSVWGATFNFGDGVKSKDGLVKVGFDFTTSPPTTHVYATNDDGSEREVSDIAGNLEQDFGVVGVDDDGKVAEIDKFLLSSRTYIDSIAQILHECERNFG